jgi:hypothetical protein
MIYEIVTPKWTCPVCQGLLRLRFEPGGQTEENEEVEYLCEEVRCPIGHELPEELVQEARIGADAEFYSAMEGGQKLAEVWQAPWPDQEPQEPTM